MSGRAALERWLAQPMGPSGSGKSTRLNLVAGLDRPGGTVVVDAVDLGDPLAEVARIQLRACQRARRPRGLVGDA